MRHFCSAFFVIAFGIIPPAQAFAACDEPYGLCMSQCATSSQPERCMQRCQQSLNRCSKSGVFQMPLGFQYLLRPTRKLVMYHRLFNRLKQLLGRYRLGQEIRGTRLDRSHGCSNICVARKEHDRQGRAQLAQGFLQFGAAQIGNPHVEKNTARLIFVW